jgi:hypothetical protein
VKTEISVFHICKIAVSAFFENFGFKSKIDSADTNNAGDYGAANAGDRGAANAGDRGSASVKENGVAIASTAGKVKGGKGSVLVLVNRDNDGNITGFAAAAVDGATLLPDTWYHLKEGKFVAEE